MARQALVISMLAGAALAAPAHGHGFLKAPSQKEQHSMRKDVVEQALLSGLSVLTTSAEIHTFEEELRPLYAAMPKNEHGRLEPSAVRYALHRYFVQKHGWYVKGLERAGGTWEAPTNISIMKDQAPAYIQDLLSQRLHGQGLGLEELAVFAATLSDLIRGQTVGELEFIYDTMGFPKSTRQPAWVFDDVLKMYLVAFIYGLEEGGTTLADLTEYEAYLAEEFIRWPEAQLWARDVRHAFDRAQQSVRNPFVSGVSFEEALEFEQEFAHRYSAFHNMECRSLKEKLLELEHQGTGRVRLAKFYSGKADPDWPFLERVDYLRALGALDETDPSRPSVVIANYLGSQSNCHTPSDFYSVCCLDECEGLMAHVERSLGEPTAAPERIAEVVSGLGSDTVDAPRNLSTTQRFLLREIASRHDGHVPLHGRLFAQWMHHAYPRECPFPHTAGTTNPLSPDDWMDEMELDSITVSDEEVQRHVSEGVSLVDKVEELPWTAVEELVASHTRASSTDSRMASQLLRMVAVLAVLASATFSAGRASGSLWKRPAEGKEERHLV